MGEKFKLWYYRTLLIFAFITTAPLFLLIDIIFNIYKIMKWLYIEYTEEFMYRWYLIGKLYEKNII